jgi:secondary thiamine-phosphate synthase enzyme
MKAIPADSQTVRTRLHTEMINVTPRVATLARERGVRHGMAIVYVPHTTAAVTLNENADPDVPHDLLKKLETLVPRAEPFYQHGEGNSDAHVKTTLVGNSVTVLIESGRLILGQWQAIWFCEFDGPREREMIIKLVDFE